jgi:flagellin
LPVINTNISSLYSLLSLNTSESILNEANMRLSSGKKLNSAADDAAGMAISTRMNSQVRGLNMAIKNVGDGISVISTIESSLNEITNMLHRMRELSVQAANDINSGTDRNYLQEEVNQLKSEITNLSSDTQFNGIKVLDGTFTDKAIQIGTNAGQTVNFSVESVSSSTLGAFTRTGVTKEAATAAATVVANTNTTAEDLSIHGNTVSKDFAASAAQSAKTLAAAINVETGNTGVKAEAKTYAKLLSTAAAATYSITLNGTSTGNFSIGSTSVGDAVTKINQISGTTGVTAAASSDGSFVTLHHSQGEDISVINDSAGTDLDVVAVGFDGTTAGSTVISLAATAGNDSTSVQGNIQLTSSKTFSITQAGTPALGYFTTGSSSLTALSNVDIKTAAGASTAIGTIDGALERISSLRSIMGALQNRFSRTIENLSNMSANTQAAISRIVDADFAVETAKLTRAQILQQTSTAMLAQANQSKQNILTLLSSLN